MPNKKYQKWRADELANEIIIHAKLGLEASPKQIHEACQIIANITTSGITRRAEREARKRIK